MKYPNRLRYLLYYVNRTKDHSGGYGDDNDEKKGQKRQEEEIRKSHRKGESLFVPVVIEGSSVQGRSVNLL